MLIETPDGTWTSKVVRAGEKASTPTPNTTLAKVVHYAQHAPGDDDQLHAPGNRLFDQPGLYDHIFGWDPGPELDFITSTVQATRLVEFGCGSGRVLLPLLERGYQVDGIDSSSAALGYLCERVKEQSPDYRPHLILGDIAEVALLPAYPGAFAALNTLRCLPSTEAVAAHLRRAAMSVEAGGTYLIHLDSFGVDVTERPSPGEYGEWEGFGESDSDVTVRWELAERYDGPDHHDLEIERVRIWRAGSLIVDELLSQLSLSISHWAELFAAEGLWAVSGVFDEDDFTCLDLAAQRQAPSSNYWFVLERTDRPAPPLFNA